MSNLFAQYLLLALIVSCSGEVVSASPLPVVCASAQNGGAPPLHSVYMDIACPSGAAVASINVTYGTFPAGYCGSLTPTSCNINTSMTEKLVTTCMGKQSCRLWPNTTTLGDPCFGTVKVLVTEVSCSTGSPSVSSNYPAAPVPVPPAPVNCTVTVNWNNKLNTVTTSPSLQVVAHALLMRDSPIHDTLFKYLAALNASYVRYVPWLPTPMLGVAALNPPSGKTLCGGEPVPAQPGAFAALDCGDNGGTIDNVTFASFGNPTGHCGSFLRGSCHAPSSEDVVQKACLGKQSCVLSSSATDFPGLSGACAAHPTLAVAVTCSNASKQHTYWNFTLLDHQMLDYWNAVQGQSRPMIPNFSTAPTWLYDATQWGYGPIPCTAANTCKYGGYEKGSAPASAFGGVEALGDYYGRLLSWYNLGGFQDEYGNNHTGGHRLNITMWEIFNEVDHEHGQTPQSYTEEYDAIVQGIRKLADPEHNIKFVGMSLPNIDLEPAVIEWTKYFLNASNHQVGARDALDFIGFHSYPTGPAVPSGGFRTHESYSAFFGYADQFMSKVLSVQEVIAKQSPSTRICLDESGTASGLLSIDDPVYFVASGGYFAYLWSRSASLGDLIPVVGQSQFMDSPDREAPVTMMDWRTGQPTAKYWALSLLLEHVTPGKDIFVSTSSSAATVHAQGFLHGTAQQVLLINKVYAPALITLSSVACSVSIVDAKTNQGPPRLEHYDACTVNLSEYAIAIVQLSL